MYRYVVEPGSVGYALTTKGLKPEELVKGLSRT